MAYQLSVPSEIRSQMGTVAICVWPTYASSALGCFGGGGGGGEGGGAIHDKKLVTWVVLDSTCSD